ncbi:MAG: hypothetical protein Q8900_00970 [Bacillota bacterium]|nr:hypothetical protein [Bacillota bacterium]
MKMNEKEELKNELEQELKWVQYRQKMLDIIEEKLLQMKHLIEEAKENNLSSDELDVLNDRINKLAVQVKAIDSESRKTEDERILE